MSDALPLPRPVPPPGAPVGSPCTGVCRMDEATGWCLGCARTLAEIAAWGGLDDAARRTLWLRLPDRQARLQARGTAPGSAAR